jgi:mannose-6-phosphate isomerase-like protein (cupin superfamily)
VKTNPDRINETDQRPWGSYVVLADEADHKVKRIAVLPGKRLSLQRHTRRSEHWYFLRGQGRVICGEREIEVQAGSAINIPCMTLHRIENIGDEPLVLIEVQRGDYLGEDDIERFEDDYGRCDAC